MRIGISKCKELINATYSCPCGSVFAGIIWPGAGSSENKLWFPIVWSSLVWKSNLFKFITDIPLPDCRGVEFPNWNWSRANRSRVEGVMKSSQCSCVIRPILSHNWCLNIAICPPATLSEFFLSPRPSTKSQDLCTFSLNAVSESSFIILRPISPWSVGVWWEYVSINPGTSFNPDTGNRVYAGFPHISPLCPNHDFAN